MNAFIQKSLRQKETQRFVKYMVVGGIGTLVDITLLTVLKHFALPTLLANTLSYSAGIVCNFALNRRWTFSEARSKPSMVQFVQFTAVSIVGLLLNNAVVTHLEGAFAGTFGESNSVLPAKIVATLVGLIWNFSANRLWTFNDVGSGATGLSVQEQTGLDPDPRLS